MVYHGKWMVYSMENPMKMNGVENEKWMVYKCTPSEHWMVQISWKIPI